MMKYVKVRSALVNLIPILSALDAANQIWGEWHFNKIFEFQFLYL